MSWSVSFDVFSVDCSLWSVWVFRLLRWNVFWLTPRHPCVWGLDVLFSCWGSPLPDFVRLRFGRLRILLVFGSAARRSPILVFGSVGLLWPPVRVPSSGRFYAQYLIVDNVFQAR